MTRSSTTAAIHVIVRRAELKAIADDAADATRVLHVAEDVLGRALAEASKTTGEEIIILRRVDLLFNVDLDGLSALTREDVEQGLSRALAHRIARAKSVAAAAPDGMTEDAAWFPSEAAAIGQYLVALTKERATAWPYRALRHYGATWSDVLRGILLRERALSGDILAHVFLHIEPEDFVNHLDEELASAIVEAWAQGAAPLLAKNALPLDIQLASAALATRLAHHGSTTTRHVVILSHLFARWPPARDLRIRHEDIRLLAQGSSAPSERIHSSAGGLLVWATLLEHFGLDAALDHAHPERRARNAVRWAIGRALEDPRLDGADPLLLLWSGEEPTAAVAPSIALGSTSAEPLHHLAIRAAQQRGCFEAPLEAAQLGDTVVLTSADGFAVDALIASDLHASIPELVQRFIRRAGAPPTGITVANRVSPAALDALMEIDVPSLPESFRAAVRAFASLARTLLQRHYRARMRDLRGWAALLDPAACTTVEIRSSDIERVAGGLWRRGAVRLSERSIALLSI